MFNRDLVFSALRHGLTALGSVFVTSGLLTASEVETGSGAMLALLSIGWMIYKRKK